MKIFAVFGLFLVALHSAVAGPYSFSVNVIGHGRPVILIPGLACTGDVWDGTIAHLKSRCELYVLTLPGFGKQPPISGEYYVPRVRDEIIAFVKEKKLDHPAVIGHSLGGFMLYSLAEKEPRLWGPMISVDGLPFVSVIFNPNATAETIKPMANMIANQLVADKPEAFKASVKRNLQEEITDPKDVAAIYAFASDSNPVDVAQAMWEIMTTDLRPGLSKIESPFLLLGAGRLATTDAQKKALSDLYQAQVKGMLDVKVQMDWNSRHFIMLDDPGWFYRQVDDFLARH